jgi:antitoxin VapB
VQEAPVRTRLFKSGNSLAVRIPKELHFDAPADDVEIERVGDTLVVRPVGPPLTGVLKKFAAFSPDFMRAGRGSNTDRDRNGW